MTQSINSSPYNKNDYWTLLLVVGGIIYFLNNAFCLFYGKVPIGKMHDEGVMLVHKVDNVLIKHQFCKNYYGCVSRQMVFFDINCTEIEINFYSGIYMDETVRSEIIAEISRYSTYAVDVSFYDESHDSYFFLTSFPTTDLYIKKKS